MTLPRIDVCPSALAVGGWSLVDGDGISTGVLMRLFLPEGLRLELGEGCTPVALAGEGVVDVRLDEAATRVLIADLEGQLAVHNMSL